MTALFNGSTRLRSGDAQLRTPPTITESQSAVVRRRDSGCGDSSALRAGVDRAHDQRGLDWQRWTAVGSELDKRGTAAVCGDRGGDCRLGRPRGGFEDHGLAAEQPGAQGVIAQDGQNRIYTPRLGVNDISGLSKLAVGRKHAHESLTLGVRKAVSPSLTLKDRPTLQ